MRQEMHMKEYYKDHFCILTKVCFKDSISYKPDKPSHCHTSFSPFPLKNPNSSTPKSIPPIKIPKIMNSYTNSSNFDNLLLQNLMGRLQIRPQNPLQPQLSPLLNQTLEDLLFDTINNISDTETDQDDDENNRSGKSQLAKEESKLEKEVIRIILSGNTEETLKPNSGQAVTIGEHHICVGYHMEPGSEYRVWEWHGHIMLFDDENGYNPEYIYGNYFERLRDVIGKMKQESATKDVGDGDDDEKEKNLNSGLKELIGSSDGSGSGRILHRNMNVGSSRT